MGNRIERVMIVGPLAVFADGFAAELERLGYSPFTAVEHVRLMAHLSHWMADGGVDVAELTVARAHVFLADRRERGHARRCSPRALDPLLEFLRGLGVAPPATPAPIRTVTDRLLAEFENHLLADRGLSDRTVAGYRRVAMVFLADRFPDEELRLEQLTAADVSAFMLEQAGWRTSGALSTMVTGLRALLRFVYLRGYTPLALAAAVPGVAQPRPRVSVTLSPEEVDKLLVSCDQSTAIGLRDHAIVTVLARLGLRAGEVASLCLEDIDWRAGELVVRCKGSHGRLPLPVDVGRALANYLRQRRPVGNWRNVFLQASAPHSPLGRCGVSHVVQHACRRAGVNEVRAHRLRHSAAMQMRGDRDGPPPGQAPRQITEADMSKRSHRHLTDAERDQRRTAQREQLERACRELISSEEWRQWVRVRAANGLGGRYSFYNQCLLASQARSRGIELRYVTGFRTF